MSSFPCEKCGLSTSTTKQNLLRHQLSKKCLESSAKHKNEIDDVNCELCKTSKIYSGEKLDKIIKLMCLQHVACQYSEEMILLRKKQEEEKLNHSINLDNDVVRLHYDTLKKSFHTVAEICGIKIMSSEKHAVDKDLKCDEVLRSTICELFNKEMKKIIKYLWEKVLCYEGECKIQVINNKISYYTHNKGVYKLENNLLPILVNYHEKIFAMRHSELHKESTEINQDKEDYELQLGYMLNKQTLFLNTTYEDEDQDLSEEMKCLLYNRVSKDHIQKQMHEEDQKIDLLRKSRENKIDCSYNIDIMSGQYNCYKYTEKHLLRFLQKKLSLGK